ncbi:hypothetical protein AWQ00_12575 [Escherichia coli]|nr:hypothetical protein AWP53_27535 [Escherichia coli]OKW08927.1 hypothetical protein AWP69_00195 [Escherichia coli]OKX38915.1 hypothetical protein AWQ00_12575 [Escherichia coli]
MVKYKKTAKLLSFFNLFIFYKDLAFGQFLITIPPPYFKHGGFQFTGLLENNHKIATIKISSFLMRL